jgi:hypothetical protein
MPFAVLLNQYTDTRGFAWSILEQLHILHDSFKSVSILKHLDVIYVVVAFHESKIILLIKNIQ